MGIIIETASAAALLPIIFSVVYVKMNKADKPRKQSGVVIGKRLFDVIAFGVLSVLSYIGIIISGALCAVYKNDRLGYILVTVFFVDDAFALTGCLAYKFVYHVFCEDRIVATHLFKKESVTYYSDLSCYKLYTVSRPKAFVIFDKHDVTAIYINEVFKKDVAEITRILESHGITAKPND